MTQPTPHIDTDARRQINELRGAMVRISDAVERLARLEERHTAATESLGRAFDKLSEHGDRIATLERTQPLTNLATRWVFNSVVTVVGAVGGVALSQFIK